MTQSFERFKTALPPVWITVHLILIPRAQIVTFLYPVAELTFVSQLIFFADFSETAGPGQVFQYRL